MRYQLAPISTRPWLLNGLSLRLIESHYENHYGGALRRLNAITEQLESLDFEKTPAHVVNGLKREELIALNSTLLHELYFASMAFGDGRPNALAYIDAFHRNIDWVSTQARYEDASKVEPPRPLVQKEFGDLPGVGPEEVKAMLDSGEPVQVIDARPRSYISRQQDIMDGAVWRDPERLQDWIGELSKSDPVVVFCAYGFHVGCKTAIALREAGFDAKYMKGGHSAWKAIGGPMKLYT
jgi:rhodanese-related sulfurtransferase